MSTPAMAEARFGKGGPVACPACGGVATQRCGGIGSGALRRGYADAFGVRADALPTGDRDTIELLRCEDCDLRWFNPLTPGNDGFYEALQQHAWYYQDDKPEYGIAAAWIQPGARVLEVGCGKGAFAAFLDRPSSYRGLEFNALAVDKATRAGLDVVRRSIEDEARARPGGYDSVCHFQVLEHVPDVRSFMQACTAALAPGGVLVVAVPSEDSFLALAAGSWLNMPPHHLTRWSDRALRALADRLGLEAVTLVHEPVASFHRDWHAQVMREHGLRRLLNLQPTLDRQPLIQRVARQAPRLPWAAGRLENLGRRHHPFPAHGHTVLLKGVKPTRSPC